jgi:hypothetical protein|tara:strand:- start:1295 stop:1609 length:315 start_codon:yes stop_codon:yes gene_type:complete
MSFKVSSSFKWNETTDDMDSMELFQFCELLNVKHAQNAPQNTRRFSVSVVSIYIPTSSETAQKVFRPCKRGRVMLISSRQNYTIIPAAPDGPLQLAVIYTRPAQ